MQALEAFKSLPTGISRNGGMLCELEESVPAEKLLKGFVLTEREVGWGTGDQPEECWGTIEDMAEAWCENPLEMGNGEG